MEPKHAFNVQAETRELLPVNGWRRYEATGKSCATCPCGLNTGYIPTADAWATARTHAQQ
ncbi:hypothetical protein AB0K87_11075 [Streptomyces sp. NPDC053705]|uniref:hypothetical protein n=1 Tax=Streptomyces sp. NPDC053705 TaxID=3156668 RepID=UPI003443EE47